MTETELPASIEYLIITLQIIALAAFLYFIWPLIKNEQWKAKFIDNKTARSTLIVFILIFIFFWSLSAFFDTFFLVEELR